MKEIQIRIWHIITPAFILCGSSWIATVEKCKHTAPKPIKNETKQIIIYPRTLVPVFFKNSEGSSWTSNLKVDGEKKEGVFCAFSPKSLEVLSLFDVSLQCIAILYKILTIRINNIQEPKKQ